MTKMKKLTLSLSCLLTILFLFACDTNKKLDPDNAAKAIRQFVSSNKSALTEIETNRNLIEPAISSIEPLSQFSETEASSIVHFNFYHSNTQYGNVALKFKFQRNIDKKWILTALEFAGGGGLSPAMENFVRKFQNINIVAQ